MRSDRINILNSLVGIQALKSQCDILLITAVESKFEEKKIVRGPGGKFGEKKDEKKEPVQPVVPQMSLEEREKQKQLGEQVEKITNAAREFAFGKSAVAKMQEIAHSLKGNFDKNHVFREAQKTSQQLQVSESLDKALEEAKDKIQDLKNTKYQDVQVNQWQMAGIAIGLAVAVGGILGVVQKKKAIELIEDLIKGKTVDLDIEGVAKGMQPMGGVKEVNEGSSAILDKLKEFVLKKNNNPNKLPTEPLNILEESAELEIKTARTFNDPLRHKVADFYLDQFFQKSKSLLKDITEEEWDRHKKWIQEDEWRAIGGSLAAKAKGLGLDVADGWAIRDYLGGGYKDMNNFLIQSTKEVDSIIQQRIDVLKDSLKKVPRIDKNKNPLVARYIEVDNLEEILSNYKKGGTVVEPRFTSTSTTVDYPVTMMGSSSNIKFTIIPKDNSSGRMVGDLNLLGEKEVLFPPATKFKINDKREIIENGMKRWLIEMEEIG